MVALVLAGGYLALCGVARALYPRALFPAPQVYGTPEIGDPNASLVTMGTTIGLYWPAPSETARTIVMFHGNGETIFHGVQMGTELHRRGLGVLLVEYRGYGTLHGDRPSEAMLYEDGESAITWLAKEKGITDDRLTVFGWSLGSSVAAEMAYRGHGSRLVLVSPFTSIVAMGKRFAPILPVSLIMSHRLDTISKAPKIEQPALVIHGDADELIPVQMGRDVAAKLPNSTLIEVARGHHADMFWKGSGTSPDAAALFEKVSSF